MTARSGRRRFAVPPSLSGRRARDPFWVAVSSAFAGMHWARGLRAATLPPVAPVDRELPLVVREVTREADGVAGLTLGAADSSVLPSWQPGCHLDVRLPSGLRRQYSLCGDPLNRRAYRIATRLIADGGGGSAEVHTLVPGSAVTVRGPRNAFPFLPRPRYLFLAGGIGITPILPMVLAAERQGADWRLVYTGRSLAALPFLDELAELPAERVHVRTDDEHGVPSAADWLAELPAGTAVYCCGPAPMIEGVRAAFPKGRGTLHYERFAPPPVVDGTPFEVRLARSGVSVQVAADRTALAAIAEAVPNLAYSCRQGFCGTCRVRVLDGAVDRRGGDRLDGSMLICVSRAEHGPLTLDL